ncbi:MAG: SGNH/GDSL hydrolase family protein [Planctomycetota bacterium]
MTKPVIRWPLKILLLAVLALYGGKALVKRMHMGNGPAGPVVKATAFDSPWSERKVHMLGFGDSVTRGFGASPGQSYFELLVSNDNTTHPSMKGCDLTSVLPGLTWLNLAVNYTTSKEHWDYQIRHLRPYPHDVFGLIVITTGGNDLIHNYGRTPPNADALYGCTIEQAQTYGTLFQQRLHDMMSKFREVFPGGFHVFMASIYDPTDGVGDLENVPGFSLPRWPDAIACLNLYNRILEECDREFSEVTLVDMRTTMLGHGIHFQDRENPHYKADDPHYWYFENLEDPNDRGYDAIRRTFLNSIQQTLPPLLQPKVTHEAPR